jgi:hypothetical protein
MRSPARHGVGAPRAPGAAEGARADGGTGPRRCTGTSSRARADGARGVQARRRRGRRWSRSTRTRRYRARRGRPPLGSAGAGIAAAEGRRGRGTSARPSWQAAPRAITPRPTARWASASSTRSPSRPVGSRRRATRSGCSSSTGTCTTETARRTRSTRTRPSISFRSTSRRTTRGPGRRTSGGRCGRRVHAQRAAAGRRRPARSTGSVFERAVLEATDGFRPDFVLVSAGFDVMAGDPLGGLLLEPEDLHAMTRFLVGARRRGLRRPRGRAPRGRLRSGPPGRRAPWR